MTAILKLNKGISAVITTPQKRIVGYMKQRLNLTSESELIRWMISHCWGEMVWKDIEEDVDGQIAKAIEERIGEPLDEFIKRAMKEKGE